ncbi:unnamed protein product [Caenorhabditis sp. 36 PRJEB53466]|nr:unnamed protein product [Caenorhabditis sp. 36 PRJEB53466]
MDLEIYAYDPEQRANISFWPYSRHVMIMDMLYGKQIWGHVLVVNVFHSFGVDQYWLYSFGELSPPNFFLARYKPDQPPHTTYRSVPQPEFEKTVNGSAHRIAMEIGAEILDFRFMRFRNMTEEQIQDFSEFI